MSLERTRHYWASVFDLTPEAFGQPGIQLVSHKEKGSGYHDFSDYHALYALRHGAALSLSVPAQLRDAAQQRLEAPYPKPLPSFRDLMHLFADWTQRSVGPAFQGYLEASAFRPVNLFKSRVLTPKDREELEQFKAACDPEAWSHSDLSVQDRGISACFADGRIVAATKLIPWADEVVNLGVITHPEVRGLGYGATVLSSVIRPSIEKGNLLVYQTLSSNTAAVKLARKLGFQKFGKSFVLRLNADVR